MNYTKIFFSTIFDLIAIIASMWIALIITFVLVFFFFYKTGYIMNPYLPVGLFVIYALFKRDGAIERALKKDNQDS